MKTFFTAFLFLLTTSAFAQYSQYQGTTAQMVSFATQCADGTRWYNTTNSQTYVHANGGWIASNTNKITKGTGAFRLSIGYNADSSAAAHVDTLPALTTCQPGDRVLLADFAGVGATDSIRTIPLAPDSLNSTGAIDGHEIFTAYGSVSFIAVPIGNGNASGLCWRRER